MSKQLLEVKYKCMHGSCQVRCREGLICVDEGLFQELSAFYEDKDMFRSPRGICRLGFSQPFKAVRVAAAVETPAGVEARSAESADPIAILMEDHKKVLNTLERISDQIRKRDVEGLWLSTSELENEINLHSAHKEEEVLFPAIGDLLPLSEGFCAIVREEHSEVLSLLHAFRSALEDGDILDGLIVSMSVSLKSHIRKEDYEFFELINKCLDDERRKAIVEGMKKIDETYVPIEPGDRNKKTAEKIAASQKRGELDDAIAAVRDLVNTDTGCCH